MIWYILLQRFSQCNHNPSINPLIYNFSSALWSATGLFRRKNVCFGDNGQRKQMPSKFAEHLVYSQGHEPSKQ